MAIKRYAEKEIGMSNLYMKNENGKYLPVNIDKVIDKSWDNCLIMVTLGSPQNMASNLDCHEIFKMLNASDAVQALDNASFMIVEKPIKFENLGPNNVKWEHMMIKESKDE